MKKYIILISMIFNIYGIENKKIPMKINIYIESLEDIISTLGPIPVYPIGTEVILCVRILNNSNKSIAMEDYRTTQKLILYCKSEDNVETAFILNPPIVDELGEITCPLVKKIILKKEEAKFFYLTLNSSVMEKLSTPGLYKISIAYDDLYSNPLVLFMKNKIPN